jgi:S1-C subfamily serine protease
MVPRLLAGVLILCLLGIPATLFSQDEEGPHIGIRVEREVSDEEGILIEEVTVHGPAWEAGLKKGDRLLKIGKFTLEKPEEVRDAVTSHKIGDKVDFKILRGDRELTKTVKIGTPPHDPGFIGIGASQEKSDEPGAIVGSVSPDGPADKGGMQAGDRIIEINGEPIEDFEGLARIVGDLRPGKKVKFVVVREGEEEELEITMGKRPQQPGGGNPGEMGFKPRDPLELTGKAPSSAQLESAAQRGIDFLLAQQKEDGSFEPEFNGEHMLSGTADHAINPTVMTSIVGAGLRAQASLDPERVRPAVNKARRFVLDRLATIPVNARVTYAVWHYTWGAHFLLRELAYVKDKQEKIEIKTAIEKLLDTLFTMQLIKKEAEDPEDIGYIGLSPKEEDNSGLPGVLIENAPADGPAGKAGVRKGDRVLRIGDTKIEKLDDLYNTMRGLDPEQKVDVVVNRDGEEMTFEVTLAARKAPLDVEVFEEGGWNYYFMGQGASFVTATVLQVLMEAEDLGFEIPAQTKKLAGDMIEGLRQERDGDPDFYCYHIQERKSGRGSVKGGIGRIISCELALLSVERRDASNLTQAYETFLEHRKELDRVKGFEGTHFQRLWNNASYYYYYGHYYAAVGLKHIDPKLRKKVANTLREVIVMTQDKDEGFWVDHPAFSELYGTSMVLMTLRELEKANSVRQY